MSKNTKSPKTRYVAVDKRPHIYLDTITNIYVWRERIQGKLHHRSTGERGITAANTKVRKFRTEADDYKQNQDSRKETWAMAFELALKMKSQKKGKTYSEACTSYNRIKDFFEDEKYSSMAKFENDHEDTWADFKIWSTERDIKEKGKVTKLWHDRKFLTFAYNRALKKGWITYSLSAAKDLSLDHTEKVDHGTYLEDETVKDLIRHSTGNLNLQIRMAVTMGMRRGEIINLEIDEVNLEKREITTSAEKIKTGTAREVPVPISDDVFEDLKALYDVCMEKEGLFIFHGFFPYSKTPDWDAPASDISRQWDTLRRGLGHTKKVKNLKTGELEESFTIVFKDFRKTCATNMVKALIPLPSISKVLGHSIKMLTKIYNSVDIDTKQAIREVFNGKFTVKQVTIL